MNLRGVTAKKSDIYDIDGIILNAKYWVGPALYFKVLDIPDHSGGKLIGKIDLFLFLGFGYWYFQLKNCLDGLEDKLLPTRKGGN